MNIPSFLKWAGAIALLVLVVALVVKSCQSERRVREATVLTAKADSLREIAEAQLAVAVAENKKIKGTVKVIYQSDTVFAEKVVGVLLRPVPEACRPFTEPIVDLLSECQAQTAKWRGAWEDQSAVTERLLAVTDTLKIANDSLAKATKLLTPRPFSIRIPLIGLQVKPAVFGGVCASGKPCLGVGGAITF